MPVLNSRSVWTPLCSEISVVCLLNGYREYQPFCKNQSWIQNTDRKQGRWGVKSGATANKCLVSKMATFSGILHCINFCRLLSFLFLHIFSWIKCLSSAIWQSPVCLFYSSQPLGDAEKGNLQCSPKHAVFVSQWTSEECVCLGLHYKRLCDLDVEWAKDRVARPPVEVGFLPPGPAIQRPISWPAADLTGERGRSAHFAGIAQDVTSSRQ